MNFAQIRKYDIANGPGIRTSIFVTGCTHRCAHCFNEAYQNFNHGIPWTKEQTDQVIKNLKEPVIAGLTLLGGEPLQQKGEELRELLTAVKKVSNKSIWLYTGDIFEEAIKDENKRLTIAMTEVVVDGPYIEEEKDLKLRFKGSRNQRIIDVQKSFKRGTTILWEEENL